MSRLVRDGDKWEGGKKSETSRQAPTRKTNQAAVDRRQNNRMLRQCPPGIAQELPYHATAVPTAIQNRVTKTTSAALPSGKTESGHKRYFTKTMSAALPSGKTESGHKGYFSHFVMLQNL